MILVFLITAFMQAAEHLELIKPQDRPCYQHDIFHEGVTLYKHPTLNVPSSEYIADYSSSIKLWGGKMHSMIHKISAHSNTGQNQVALKENATEKYAFVEDALCFVSNENNQHGLMFRDGKTRACQFIPFSQQTIHRIKASKVSHGLLYLFITNKNFGKNSTYELQLFDYKNNRVIKRYIFSEQEIEKGRGCAEYHLLETNNPMNYILYRRSADNANAWRFDASTFECAEALLYKNIVLCKTNDSLKLVAFDHDYNVISVCSSDDLRIPLMTFDLVNHHVNCLKFINDSYLALSTSTFHCPHCLAHPMTHSVHIFDLNKGSCIYRENSSFFKAQNDRIKADYDTSGNMLNDSLALFNDVHKTWYRLKFTMLVGAQKLKND